MDSIKLFLENMFFGLTPSPQVTKAKTELLAMMEDKYMELKAKGLSENESVGQVISEFGNLEELADDLGIAADYIAAQKQPANIMTGAFQAVWPAQKVRTFLLDTQKASLQIGLGVMAFILSPILLNFSEFFFVKGESGSEMSEMPGLAALFFFICIGILLCLLGGMKLSPYEADKHNIIVLDHPTETNILEQRKKHNHTLAVSIAGGIFLIFTGVLAMIGTNLLVSDVHISEPLSVAFLLIFISVGVFTFIMVGMKHDALEFLLNEGEYQAKNKNQTGNTVMDILAGPYWLLATLIYFIWSFGKSAWNISWIVWPVSGILFAILHLLVDGFQKLKNK